MHQLFRDPWAIENSMFQVRDVTFATAPIGRAVAPHCNFGD
jgi:hypothetical protein